MHAHTTCMHTQHACTHNMHAHTTCMHTQHACMHPHEGTHTGTYVKATTHTLHLMLQPGQLVGLSSSLEQVCTCHPVGVLISPPPAGPPLYHSQPSFTPHL